MIFLTLLNISCSNPVKNHSDTTLTQDSGQPYDAEEDSGAVDDSAVEDVDDSDSSVDTSDTVCENEIISVYPQDGQEDVLYRSTLGVEFLNPIDDIGISLSANGVTVDGELTVNGTEVSFKPTPPLEPLTQYEWSIHFCDEQSDPMIFQTGTLGHAFEGDLTGRSFTFDLREGEWLKPAGLGSLIVSQFTAKVLLGIESHNGEALEPIVTTTQTESDAQDMCFPVIGGVASVDFSQNPYFEISPVDIDLNVSGFPLNINDFTLSGIFTQDAERYQNGRLAGFADARSLANVVDFSAEDICQILGGFGNPCSPCSDSQSFCFELEVINLSGYNTAQSVECVLFANCHPGCETSNCQDPNLGICPQ